MLRFFLHTTRYCGWAAFVLVGKYACAFIEILNTTHCQLYDFVHTTYANVI